MDATGGYDTPHAVLTLAIAAGVGVGALCIGAAWEARRYGLALAIITAVVAGEVYGFVLTAERLITAREQAQAPLRASKAERAEAAKRLSTAEAAKRDADAAVVQKAAEKGCRENCSKLLQGQVDAAALEVQKARAATDTKKPLASPTPLADRLGVPAWIVDVVTAALGSIAANGLGCCLLAFAGHRRRPSVIPKVDTVDVERVEVVTASAPDLLRKHANRFAMDCLRPSDARARLVDIHRAYAPWCRLHGEEQRQEAQIGATLAALFREAEIPIEEIDGHLVAVGVSLKTPALESRGSKEMSLRMVVLLAGCVLINTGFAFGQGRSASLPRVALPANLEPYADVQLVSKNARWAIGLLATAQLKLDPYPEPIPGVAPDRGPKQITPECDTEGVRSFNRGYLLAHTGFNLFLSLQELGVPQVEGPHGLPGASKRSFIQFGRSALLSVWTPNQLGDLLKVRQALKDLPKSIREDLSAFLSKLTEYRQHYARLRKSRAAVLDDLFRREDHAYVWFDAAWAGEPMARPPRTGIGERELTQLLDEQIRQVSDIAKADPGRCFVVHYGPTIMLPSERLEYTNIWIYPTKYLVSFWRRREMEGTSAIADYVIAQVLETLRGA